MVMSNTLNQKKKSQIFEFLSIDFHTIERNALASLRNVATHSNIYC